MKKNSINKGLFGALLAMSLLGGVFFSGQCNAVIVDRIVAIVNSHVITLSQLEKKARPFLKEYLEEGMSPEERAQVKQTIYAKILPQMIDDYLVEQEIERLGITVSDAEVDKAIENICRNNGITRQELVEKLKEEGTSLDDYRKEVASQIEKARLISSEVQSKIVITDEQVRDYLQADQGTGEYGGPYYILDHICIVPESKSQAAKEAARQKALEALQALDDGQSFEQVARDFSSPGALASDVRLGVFSIDEMSPAIKKAVEDLKPGEYSKVIETPMGFQILKLVGISNSKEQDIDPALMEETRRKLYSQEINQRFQDWLNELRSKSAIRILY